MTMKRIGRYIMLATLMGAVAGCGGNGERAPEGGAEGRVDSAIAAAPDRDTAREVIPTRAVKDLKYAIVPGKRIGGVELGENFEDVAKSLGAPDSGDAGMGHVWGWWFSRSDSAARHSLGIYASFNDSATGHFVRQIAVTSPVFVTADGISTKSTLGDILRVYTKARAVATYTSDTGDTIYLYDDQTRGIAFDVTRGGGDSASGKCISILVHMPGISAAGEYLSARSYRRIDPPAQPKKRDDGAANRRR
jgi:hypothetical protein